MLQEQHMEWSDQPSSCLLSAAWWRPARAQFCRLINVCLLCAGFLLWDQNRRRFEGFSMVILFAREREASCARWCHTAWTYFIKLLFLLPLVHYSFTRQLHSSICPIRPERQSRTVLSVIRPRGGPVRASRWNASPPSDHGRTAVCG